MGNGHRKKPFSGKQKKKQLQAKNASKRDKIEEGKQHKFLFFYKKKSLKYLNKLAILYCRCLIHKSLSIIPLKDSDNEESKALNKHAENIKDVKNEREPSINEKKPNNMKEIVTLSGSSKRLHSVFEKLSPQEIKAQRKASMNAFTRLPLSALEVSVNDTYTTVIDFPKRPPWNYEMTKEELEANEERYFQQWLDDVYNKYPREKLSFFEHNIDIWRQLWRVLEISDIVLIVVDIRHPLLHFPPSLYNYVVKDLKREMLLVFNKVDLVAENTIRAWTKYFEDQFPEISVVGFSCFSKDARIIDDTSTAFLQKRTKRPKKRRYQALGIKDLLMACKNVKLVKQGIVVNWTELIKQYDQNVKIFDDVSDTIEEENADDESQDESSSDVESLDIGEDIEKIENQLKTVDIQNIEASPHKSLITIGLVGHPNVGKSSLINSIFGRTVVSASKTPGHTKHFQTIHLSKNVRLCDSPGLVFPSILPKQLQILSGMYPIAQVQEPYSTVQYMAERIPLESILKLDPPPGTLQNNEWSAWDICEAFAIKRRFYTKASRPDVYRAANAILRLSNDGRILLSFKPPGFFTNLRYTDAQRNDAVKIEPKKNIKRSGDNEKPKGSFDRPKQQIGGYFELLADFNYNNEN